jgi:hypothetical protein
MRSLLLFLLLLFVGPQSWAFQYQIEAKSLLQPSLVRAQQISSFFEREGFWSVRGASFVQAGRPFDFAYVNHTWDKALLLKEGLVAPADKMGLIMRDEKLGGAVFHFQFEGSSYVLVALGFTGAELQTVLAPLKPKESFSKWSWLIPQAQAAEAACDPKTSAAGMLAASSSNLEDGALLRTIGKCAVDAVQGVRQSAESTLDFFKKLATDPGALWTEMKGSFMELKDFVLNIKSEMQDIIATFGSLPAEQKMQIACTMTGELLGGVVQSAFAAGAMAKVLPIVLMKLRKSAALLAQLADLRKRGFKVPDLNLATKEVLSCAY